MPVVAPAPRYSYDPPDYDDPEALAERFRGFGDHVIKTATGVVGWLASMSAVSDRDLPTVATALNDGASWIETNNSFAGVPALLVSARQEAMAMADPGQRSQALAFLDAIQRLPPERQNMALHLLRTGSLQTQAQFAGKAGVLEQPVIPDDIFGENVFTQAGTLDETGALTLPAEETASMDLKAALGSLFPELTVNLEDMTPIDWDHGTVAAVSDMLARNEFTASAFEGVYDLAPRSIEGLNQTLTGIARRELTPWEAGRGFFLSALALPYEAGTNAVLTGAGLVAGGATATFGGDAEATRRAVWRIYDNVEREISEATTNVMLAAPWAPDRADFDSQDEYQAAVDDYIANNAVILTVAGLAAGELIGRGARRVALTRSIVGNKDVVRETLRATLPTKRTGVLGTAAEIIRLPVRKITNKFDDWAIRFARDPEQWFVDSIGGRQGRKFLDNLALAKQAHPGDIDAQVAFMQEVYGTSQLGGRFLQNLLAAPTRDAAKRLFIETTTRQHHGMRVLQSTKKRLAVVNEKIKTISAEPDGDPDKLARLIVEKHSLENKINSTFDNEPLLRYPRQSVFRSIVRQPTTPFQRRMAALLDFTHFNNGGFFDLAKLVDEQPRRPSLFVPNARGTASVSDWKSRNATTLSTFLRRLGMSREQVQKLMGRVASADTDQDFYEIVEHEVFGEKGAINAHLKGRVDDDLRNALIHLHDSRANRTTRSVVTEKVDTPYGTKTIETNVLQERLPDGTYRPLPSRDTEFIERLYLPDVETVIDASSFIRRAIRKAEVRGGAGNVAAKMMWKVPIAAARIGTMFLKPAVMIVRLPAMIMRIQLEQAMRINMSGYGFWPSAPQGVFFMPGGIPIPFTKRRALQSLFGKDGWRLLDPDPEFDGFSIMEHGGEMGNVMDEIHEVVQVQLRNTTTGALKNDPSTIRNKHTEAGRQAVEQIHKSRIDREIARRGLDEESFMEWLDNDPWAREFMETHMNPMLLRSAVYQHLKSEQGASGVGPSDNPRVFTGGELPGDVADDPNFWYHTTQTEGLEGIKRTGEIEPRQQTYGIPEDRIPPEMRGGRAFVADSGDNAFNLTSFNARRVLIRIPKEDVTQPLLPDTAPGVEGSFYTRVPISTAHAEVLTPDGWRPIKPEAETRVPVDDEIALALAREEWVRARIQHVTEVSGGDSDVLEAMATGRLRIGHRRDFDPSTDVDGKPYEIDYDQARADIGAINAELSERLRAGQHLFGDDDERAIVKALQEQRRLAIERRNKIEKEYPDVKQGVKSIEIGDKRAFRNALKLRWEDNPDRIPPILSVPDRLLPESVDNGVLDTIRQMGQVGSNLLYRGLTPLTYYDVKGTRGSLFTQVYGRTLRELEARGYTSADAKAVAYARAGAQTRDLMYDLTARTSVQRALKDIFWFAPAQQEVLYTWFVKIPAQSYGAGYAQMAARFLAAKEALRAVGILQEDANGEEVLVIPGAQKFLQAAAEVIGSADALIHPTDFVEHLGTDIKVPEITYGYLSGLNLVTSGGGVPGLSTPANWALGKAAIEHGGVFKELSDIFQPYGPETSILPQPLNHIYETLTGDEPPWSGFSGEYVKAQWDRSFDQGLQYAYAELQQQGVLPPRPEDFEQTEAGREAYAKANRAYLHRLMGLGEEYARGIAFVRLNGSTWAPLSLSTTSEEREGFRRFWEQVIVPEGFEEGLSDRQKEMIDAYVEKYPNSVAFATFYTGYGRKQRDLPFDEDLDDAFFDDYFTGLRRTLEPEEYSQKLMAVTSLRFYQSRLDNELNNISPTRNPWELLTQGFERSQAILDYQDAWERYKFFNPDAAGFLTQQRALWLESQELPVDSFEAERLSELLRLTKTVSPMLTGDAPVRPDYLREFLGNVQSLYSETNKTFGPAITPTDKAIDWWWKNVGTPYVERTGALYAEAQEMENHGLNPSAVYEEIRQLGNAQMPKYKGTVVPSPEEVFYNNKSESEREATRLSWASRPITWLSDFQQETVGYNLSDAAKNFLTQAAAYDRAMFDYINKQGISYSSAEYEQLIARRDELLASAAEDAGPDVAEAFALSEAPPIVRLTTVGWGRGVPQIDEVTTAAQDVYDYIVSNDLSPKGFSELAVSAKSWLYTTIQQERERNEQLDTLLTELSYSFPLSGGGYREGAVLYEALFFGNFNTDHIPYQIAVIGV